MVERLQDKPKVRRIGASAARGEVLPYRVELREAADRDAAERVLARAFNAALARAIFRAVQTEHPGRRIVLCRGARILDDTAK